MVNHFGATDTWNIEGLVEKLKTLHAEGVGYTQIANMLNAEFKTSFTKSSITGKVWRLKLNRAEIEAESKYARRIVQPLQGAAALQMAKAASSEAEALRRKAAEITEAPRGGFVSALALNLPDVEPSPVLGGSEPRPFTQRLTGQCSWPVGEETGAGQLSCCRPVKHGKGYFTHLWCEEHHAIGTRAPVKNAATQWTAQQRAEHGAKIRAGRARRAA